MSENVEQIEARLCAFVDGELGPEERAEIEAHLAANPSHRAMIQDLVAQRAALRGLPRERAPRDLAESLQGQLERESLLGADLLGDSRMSLRMRRWPQVLAVAAIILLAIGLGAAVYMVLPPAHPEVALVMPPVDLSMTSKGGGDLSATSGIVDVDQMAQGSDELPDRGELAPAMPLAGRPDASRSSRASELLPRDAKEGMTGGLAVNAVGFFGAENTNETLVIRVKTSDVNLANDRLISYLSQNSIAWTSATDRPLDRAAVAQTAETLPELVAMPATQPADLAVAAILPHDTAKSERVSDETSTAGRREAKTAPAEGDISPLSEQRAARMEEADRQPALNEQPEQSVGGLRMMRQVVLMRDRITLPTNDRVILARDVNAQQLVELTAAISSARSVPAPREDAVVMVSRIWPMTRPSTMALAHGANEPAVMLGKAAGAGESLGREPARREVVEKAAESPVVGSDRMDARESNQPVEKPEGGGRQSGREQRSPSTQPATGEAGQAILFGAGPASRPASDLANAVGRGQMVGTEVSAGAFNCVIVFEGAESTPPMAATRPATQTPPGD